MTVLRRASHGAKRVARWQRRVWFAEAMSGPILVLSLVIATTAMARRLTRHRRTTAAGLPNVSDVPPTP
jgi:hypothetical protein